MATFKVAPSGGDYTTLSAAVAALPTTFTEDILIELEAFDLVDRVTIAALNFGAFRLTIAPASGHEHNGVFGAGARIRGGSGATGPTITIPGRNITLRGIQVTMDRTGVSYECLSGTAGQNDQSLVIDGCLFDSVATASDAKNVGLACSSIASAVVRNSITRGACRSIDTRSTPNMALENSTFWRTTSAIGVLTDSTTLIRNCYSGSSTTGGNDFWTSGTSLGSNNASADSTASRFSSSFTTVSGAAAFESTGTSDFRPKTGSALIDAGVTISAVTTDAAGITRPQGSAYDIGAFEVVSAGDPPSGTVTISDVTPSSASAVVTYSYSASDQTGFEYRLNGGTAAALGASPATISGLTASTSYNLEVRAVNANGPGSWSTMSAFTTPAATDTTPPTLTGSVTFASITQTSYTASWPAGSDNVAVTGYEYQIGSTAGAWTDAGNSLSAAISGRTAGTTETVYVRAYDAAGNRSTPAISGAVTLLSAAATITVGSALYPIKYSSASVLNETGLLATVLRADTLASVLTVSGVACNAGVITISNAALTAGTTYHLAVKTASGWTGLSDEVIAA